MKTELPPKQHHHVRAEAVSSQLVLREAHSAAAHAFLGEKARTPWHENHAYKFGHEETHMHRKDKPGMIRAADWQGRNRGCPMGCSSRPLDRRPPRGRGSKH